MIILLPKALQRFSNDQESLSLPCKQLGTLAQELRASAPQLAAAILDEQDMFKPFVKLFLNQEPINTWDSRRSLQDHDEIRIITALVGG